MSNREQTTLQRQQHQIGIHDKYLSQWKSIATEANLYRLAIRQRLMSSHPETDEDRKWDAYFTAQVSNPNDTAQLRNAANYLLAIATTLSPESN